MRETARGRAFLAHYAGRVQQSDTLTMLAMLGRLERLSQELASRIANLETGYPPGARYLVLPPAVGSSPHETAPTIDYGDSDGMRRIDGLASVLDDLHGHTTQLAAERAGIDRQVIDRQANADTFLEIDPRAFMPSEPTTSPSLPAGSKDAADNEILGSIAEALGP